MQQWDYSAPVYGSVALDSSLSDSFFSQKEEIDCDYMINEKIEIKQEIFTPVIKPYENEIFIQKKASIKKEKFTPLQNIHRRRSKSVHELSRASKFAENEMNEIVENLRDIEIAPKKHNRIQIIPSKRALGKKSLSVTSLNSNASKKFVSTAEAIYYLQKDTPERFHSHSNKENKFNFIKQKMRQLHSTIPQSPMLRSKTRTRTVHALSQKEIEDLEVEQMKKYKLKANPVSQAVLQGIPHLGPVDRKPVTRPEPFNLTQIRKKPIVSNSPDRNFHARPIPKHIFEKNMELQKKIIPCTVPRSPNITKLKKSRSLDRVTPVSKLVKQLSNPSTKPENISIPDGVGHTGVPLCSKPVIQPCKPKPFSFMEKDKERLQKKMEKISKFLDDEKKKREFHANPLPSTILKKAKIIHTSSPKKPQLFERIKDKKENKENKPQNDQSVVFKARPATVLSKKPFVPVFSEKFLTEPCPIQLTTEQRSKERQLFDMHMKEKEEKLEVLRKIQEEKRKQIEEQERLNLRAQMVHKAAPIRQYAPVVIHPSVVAPTVAKSPNFTYK